jgi:hypothetical protein
MTDVIDRPSRQLVASHIPYGVFLAGDTTPVIGSIPIWLANNTIAVTITDFVKGLANITITVIGDGFTTVADNANIKTTTSADKLLAVDRAYMFIHINSVWIEVGP